MHACKIYSSLGHLGRSDYSGQASRNNPHVFIDLGSVVLVPPMFPEPISCTNTKAGAYLLKCQAEGNPKTPIVWYKDGEIIQVRSITTRKKYNNQHYSGC